MFSQQLQLEKSKELRLSQFLHYRSTIKVITML